jgi:glycosyltransferase involved in cell wall biosynthesis
MDENIKILIATGIYPPDIGGPATYTSTLKQGLGRFGFDVQVVAYSDVAGFREAGVYRISRQHNKLVRYFLFFWRVYRLAKWADIIYVQDLISEGIPARLACRLRGKKYILKIVGDYAWEQSRQKYGVEDHLDDFQEKSYSRPVERLRRLEHKTARDADRIVVPSQYLAGIVGKWVSNKDKINVIYNGIPAPQVNLTREQARNELGFSGKVILSAGRLVPWKGYGTLISLMPELIKLEPELKLCIIGGGPLEQELRSKAAGLGMENRVVLTGPLPQPQLHKNMAGSDMFVLNTAYEGLPHIVIEAMHFRLPVIATRIGGNPEVIRPGRNGLLVEYDNRAEIKSAIQEYLTQPDKARGMAEQAYSDLNKFSRESMVKNTAQFLKNYYARSQ